MGTINQGALFAGFLITGGIIKLSDKGFTLKSGRVSPYFANFGLLNSGDLLKTAGMFYAKKLLTLRKEGKIDFDVLYGPPYKGIPLVASTVAALSSLVPSGDDGKGWPWATSRKEAKDHGEGGLSIGTSLKGQKVLILDDVITAGTAVKESIEYICSQGGTPVGGIVALDRQEQGKDTDRSAVQDVQGQYGIPMFSVTTLSDLIAFLQACPAESGDDQRGEILEKILAYQRQYGVR